MKVFVAEASPLVRTRLEEWLGESPSVVVVDAVGKSSGVLEAIQAARPDIVILGDQPGNLIDVLAKLQDSEIPTIKIILTAFPNPLFRRRCLEAGVNYFLDKTIEFERVIEIIEGLVAQRSESTA